MHASVVIAFSSKHHCVSVPHRAACTAVDSLFKWSYQTFLLLTIYQMQSRASFMSCWWQVIGHFWTVRYFAILLYCRGYPFDRSLCVRPVCKSINRSVLWQYCIEITLFFRDFMNQIGQKHTFFSADFYPKLIPQEINPSWHCMFVSWLNERRSISPASISSNEYSYSIQRSSWTPADDYLSSFLTFCRWHNDFSNEKSVMKTK